MVHGKKLQLIGGIVAAACLLVGIYYISFLVVSPSENSVKVRKKIEEKRDICEVPKRVASEYMDLAKVDNWKEAHHRFWPSPGAPDNGPDKIVSAENSAYWNIKTYQPFYIELTSQQCEGKKATLEYSAKSKNNPDSTFKVYAEARSPEDSDQWYVTRVRISPK